MRSELVQRWIDLSVAVTRQETTAIPLIDKLDLPDLDEQGLATQRLSTGDVVG